MTHRPSTNPREISNKLSGITLGAGLRFVAEGTLVSQFAPFGFTRRSFRTFMRALGVPHILTPSGIRLYSLYAVFVALQAISTIGTAPFGVGGYSRDRLTKAARAKYAWKMDPALLEDCEKHARSILHASHIFRATKAPYVFASHVRAAAAHLAALNVVVTKHQRAIDNQLRKQHAEIVEIPDTGPLPSFPDSPSIMAREEDGRLPAP